MKRIHIKISALLLLIFIALGIFYVFLASITAKEYLQEAKQKANEHLAKNIVNGVSPLMREDIKEDLVQHIMHFVVAINPSVDVYLLNPDGKIFTKLSSQQDVILDQVDLSPIKTFIDTDKKPFIKGDNPMDKSIKSVFSAAPINNQDGVLIGYVYIILDNENSTIATKDLVDNFFPRYGASSFFFALFAALILGLLAIWFLTRNFRNYIKIVEKFKNGDLSVRVNENELNDLPLIGETFNNMAAKIEGNVEQLKNVELLRRELVANISHDLRTPLVVIQGYVETMLLKHGSLSKSTEIKYLNTILNSSEKLAGLISQLFEYSKLEANQATPSMEAFDIADLAQDTVQSYEVICQEKAIDIQIENTSDKLPLVYGDIQMIERVFQNLIDNAIKFSPPEGNIKIILQKQQEQVQVFVNDSGPGIPIEKQKHIFNRYLRTDLKSNGKNEGIGLGLAIVKKILELHKTEITLDSKAGKGTSFGFNLPIA